MVCLDTPCSIAVDRIIAERILLSAINGSAGAIMVYRSYMVFRCTESIVSTSMVEVPAATLRSSSEHET